MSTIRDSLRKIANSRKLYATFGVLTGCGLIIYEKFQIDKFLSGLVNSNVLDIDKKRPDYIYIKYHIYRETMEKLKLQEKEDKNWINVIINPIGKWWKSLKHSVAWRLLNVAQYGNQFERQKAVEQLSKIDHLKDWDFQHLAQICDARTAISLARCGCDQRWFLPTHMRGVIKNPKYVLSDLHKMLEGLLPNNCVHHFFQKYFPTIDHLSEVDEFISQDIPLSVQDTDLLKEVISFLHHITKEEAISQQIIKEGGLKQLMELKKIFAKDNETLSTLCKVLANMSIVPGNVANDFFESGWIRVLSTWQNSDDIRLRVVAAKALANLDRDDVNHTLYPPNIYPLYPRWRTKTKPNADIIFIHGLLGGVFITWRQKDRVPSELGLYGKNAFYSNDVDDLFLVGETKRLGRNVNGKSKVLNMSDTATKEVVEDLKSEAELDPEWEVIHPDIPLKANGDSDGEYSVSGELWQNQDHSEYTNCWPMEWLPEDYPHLRILGIDYTSAITEWSANYTKYCPCEKGQGHIETRAASLLERLSRSDVGDDRPIIWIGHSMGGILTKLMLLKSIKNCNPQVQRIAHNTKGIVFLGTPHKGSPIAKWKQHMQLILSPSIEVKEMEEGAPRLLELHHKFMTSLRTIFRNVKIVSIAEGTPTMLTTFKFPLRIVTEESANINYGDFYVLKDDHLSLSKPIFRQSFLYQRILRVIDESLQLNGGPTENDTEPFDIGPPPVNETPTKTNKSMWSYIPGILVRYTA